MHIWILKVLIRDGNFDINDSIKSNIEHRVILKRVVKNIDIILYNIDVGYKLGKEEKSILNEAIIMDTPLLSIQELVKRRIFLIESDVEFFTVLDLAAEIIE